jgi:hypothetical protein
MREVREVLGDLDIGHPQVVSWLRDHIEQGIAELYEPSESN